MKVLVTGGAGFIGSHTLDALRARGDETALLDDFNDFYDPAIKRRHAAATGARIFEADLRDRSTVRAALRAFQPDAIIHLAARAGVRPSIENPQLYIDVNLTGTLNLLDEAVAAGIHRIVFSSSSSVYGNNPKVPFAESDPLESIISPYAVTKLAGEQLCRIHAQLYALSITALRFFTVYGPRQRPDLAISKFVRHVAAGLPIDLYGDGSSSRDYTYVDDITTGVLAALDRLQPGFRVYNIGGKHPVTLAELVTAVERVVGKTAVINRLPPQPGDVDRTWADTRRARIELDYAPRISLEEGIRRYWQWHQSPA
ncbi:NAD-dependent epimerase/dehydratase family protein [Rariglobus hedericola]|uniref:NAD-dependent epimerase/dehydratase family protein n=1 Tax=Rariglobus hedericola TaxID=2597822 RepID=A0A556QJ41_9BACT|nr:NAD-dependent epimerase/dehydratase family protein [Rariglobus hedericola]TSJ76648.1 NAD-dependent epimerase/dehydratase family protein [Rariglobus hedericola]